MGFAVQPWYTSLVWDNLNDSGLLAEIVRHKDGADVASNYTSVAIWSDLDSSMWLQVYIVHNNLRQPVTPELHALTCDVDEQNRMARRIWQGIDEDDVEATVDYCINEFHRKSTYGEISTNEAVGLRRFQDKDNTNIELLGRYAQYRITANDSGISIANAKEIIQYGVQR